MIIKKEEFYRKSNCMGIEKQIGSVNANDIHLK